MKKVEFLKEFLLAILATMWTRGHVFYPVSLYLRKNNVPKQYRELRGNIKTLKYEVHLREPLKYLKVRGKNNVFKINSNTTYKVIFNLKYSIIFFPALWRLKPEIQANKVTSPRQSIVDNLEPSCAGPSPLLSHKHTEHIDLIKMTER